MPSRMFRTTFLVLLLTFSAAGGRVVARVIRTDEEQMIVRSVCRTLGVGIAGEKRNSDHAMKYISRLDPFSEGGVPP